MINLGMEGRKWEIFESALYLFSKKGYENVSMRQIAAENGMSAASLYNYFLSKESLLELMYEFYFKNIALLHYNPEDDFELITQDDPNKVLHQCMDLHFSEELQPLMDCIYLVAIAQANRDSRAFEVIKKSCFEHTGKYINAILSKMLEAKKIEAIDMETFAWIFSSFAFTAIFFNRSNTPIGNEKWQKGLNMIFSLVKEI